MGTELNDLVVKSFSAELEKYVTDNNIEELQKTITADFNLAVHNHDGQTLLHRAAHNSNVEVVKLFQDTGIYLHPEDKAGHTPLYYAQLYDRKQVVDLLLQAPKIVNANNEELTLHSAAASGHVDIIKAALQKKVDLTSKDKFGNTILHIAAAYGKLDIVKLIISQSSPIDPHAKNEKGFTAMHLAAQNSHVEIIDFLCRHKIDPNMPDNKGYTALHYAAAKWDQNIIKLLIKAKADVNIPNNEGVTSLHIASWTGLVDNMKLLIENGADITAKNKAGVDAFHYAMNGDELISLLYLLELNKPNDLSEITDDTSLLYHVLKSQNTELFNYLKAKRAININTQNNEGNSVLHLYINEMVDYYNTADSYSAEEKSKTEESLKKDIQFLLNQGASLDTENKEKLTPLYLAMSKGDGKVIKFLFDAKPEIKDKPNSEGKTPLIQAVINGKLETVKFLVENGVNLNAQDKEGNSALHFSCAIEELKEIFELLLAQTGIDINIKNKGGNSIIHFAATLKNGVLNKLLEKNMEVDSKNLKEATPLHLAAESGYLDNVKFLLAKKADCNLKDKEGKNVFDYAIKGKKLDVISELLNNVIPNQESSNSLLHSAAEYGYEPLIKFLVSQNKDVSVKRNSDLATPLHICALNGNLKAVITLVEAGAPINIADSQCYTPVHNAVISNNIAIMEVFSKKGIKINSQTSEGKSLLHLAIEKNHEEMSQYLLKLPLAKQTFLELRDHNGQIPLHKACEVGNINIVKMLLGSIEKNALLDVPDQNGDTPLLVALKVSVIQRDDNSPTTSIKELSIADLLIEKGADINIINSRGENALHIATRKNNKELVQKLTMVLDDITIVNSEGKSAFHIAAENGHIDILKLLVESVLSMGGEVGQSLARPDAKGKTPFALGASHKEITDYLTSMGKGRELSNFDPIHKSSSGEIEGLLGMSGIGKMRQAASRENSGEKLPGLPLTEEHNEESFNVGGHVLDDLNEGIDTGLLRQAAGELAQVDQAD